MDSRMEILDAIPDLPLIVEVQPETTDTVDAALASVSRSNADYSPIWAAVRRANGLYVPVRCNSMRRAVLLASSALQHRTQAHEVKRRGRIVYIKLLEPKQQTLPGLPDHVDLGQVSGVRYE